MNLKRCRYIFSLQCFFAILFHGLVSLLSCFANVLFLVGAVLTRTPVWRAWGFVTPGNREDHRADRRVVEACRRFSQSAEVLSNSFEIRKSNLLLRAIVSVFSVGEKKTQLICDLSLCDVTKVTDVSPRLALSFVDTLFLTPTKYLKHLEPNQIWRCFCLLLFRRGAVNTRLSRLFYGHICSFGDRLKTKLKLGNVAEKK